MSRGALDLDDENGFGFEGEFSSFAPQLMSESVVDDDPTDTTVPAAALSALSGVPTNSKVAICDDHPAHLQPPHDHSSANLTSSSISSTDPSVAPVTPLQMRPHTDSGASSLASPAQLEWRPRLKSYRHSSVIDHKHPDVVAALEPSPPSHKGAGSSFSLVQDQHLEEESGTDGDVLVVAVPSDPVPSLSLETNGGGETADGGGRVEEHSFNVAVAAGSALTEEKGIHQGSNGEGLREFQNKESSGADSALRKGHAHRDDAGGEGARIISASAALDNDPVSTSTSANADETNALALSLSSHAEAPRDATPSRDEPGPPAPAGRTDYNSGNLSSSDLPSLSSSATAPTDPAAAATTTKASAAAAAGATGEAASIATTASSTSTTTADPPPLSSARSSEGNLFMSSTNSSRRDSLVPESPSPSIVTTLAQALDDEEHGRAVADPAAVAAALGRTKVSRSLAERVARLLPSKSEANITGSGTGAGMDGGKDSALLRARAAAGGSVGSIQARLLQKQRPKTLAEKLEEAEQAAGEQVGGKIVVYTSSMRAIKATANDCNRMRRLLQVLRVRFEERDVFMSSQFNTEMQSRCPGMRVPQLFFNGKLLGDVDKLTDMNDDGELEKLFASMPRIPVSVSGECTVCSGSGFYACTWCGGDRQSMVSRMGGELVKLRCTACNENGLMRCTACAKDE